MLFDFNDDANGGKPRLIFVQRLFRERNYDDIFVSTNTRVGDIVGSRPGKRDGKTSRISCGLLLRAKKPIKRVLRVEPFI